jgi:2,3-bisphosphoglycerate-independent phosphoglycerate mutase
MVLLIPDGAAEPVRPGTSTTLERARTPALDALAAAGAVRRVATTPAGVQPGSETGVPALLGAPPAIAVSRGAVEAAAHGIAVARGRRAWRVDLRRADGERAPGSEARAALGALRAALPEHQVHHLGGHRCLAIGSSPPAPALRTLRPIVWPDGALLPRTLDERTVMVCARGAASGCASLLGAAVVTPAGATGGTDTDWRAKQEAALRALDDVARVVVHAGAPDEAAHERDADAKLRALEAFDRELVGPLWAAVRARGGRLAVCPDHGTDPRSGLHDAAPVPAVLAGRAVSADRVAVRMTERAAAGRAVIGTRELWQTGRTHPAVALARSAA